jgi:hypothetical protein
MNTIEKPWNAIILVIYMTSCHENPWKVTNFQAKNPGFRVKPENFHYWLIYYHTKLASLTKNETYIPCCTIFLNNDARNQCQTLSETFMTIEMPTNFFACWAVQHL